MAPSVTTEIINFSAKKVHIHVAAVPFETIHLESYTLSLMMVALLQVFLEVNFLNCLGNVL